MADLEAVLFWQKQEEALSSSLSVQHSHQHNLCYGQWSQPAARGLRKMFSVLGQATHWLWLPHSPLPDTTGKGRQAASANFHFM